MIEQMQILVGILEKSQWDTTDNMLNKQMKHFNKLLAHAYQSVALYKAQYSAVFAKNNNPSLLDCPILTREQVQAAGDNFISTNLPAIHGGQYPDVTSGSTGKAVTIIGTDFTRLFYDALMLREHSWHQRDFSKKLMAIRWAKRDLAYSPSGHHQATWGAPINQYVETGSSVFINVTTATQDQINALLDYQPEYLITYPSQLVALAQHCVAHQISLPFLEEVRTTGETFSDDYKKIIREAWPQVKITDVYSSVEIGIMAQQCPEQGRYHVNTENVLLEIVDENNQPCGLGQSGRVLVTSLMNYATPLIRYEIGDYAEWDAPCECGRVLPVIKKILGRKRNRIQYPNGESGFPYLGDRTEFRKIVTGIQKFQFIQKTIHDIEIKLVVAVPLTQSQENQYKELIQKNFGYPFNITITYHDNIPLGPTGKYEEFISFA
jgi:phenylacetate-CoA ligase